jgi:hypothetical protein
MGILDRSLRTFVTAPVAIPVALIVGPSAAATLHAAAGVDDRAWGRR